MRILQVFLFLGLTVASANAQRTIHMILHSPAGEWVGGGQDLDLTYNEQNSPYLGAAVGLYDGALIPNAVGLGSELYPGSMYQFHGLFATNKLGHELRVGTYTNAERTEFATPGHPGMVVQFEGRVPTTVTGSFTIHGVQYHQHQSNWILDSISLSFEQYANGSSQALTGSFEYIMPEPASFAAVGIGLVAVLRRRKSK